MVKIANSKSDALARLCRYHAQSKRASGDAEMADQLEELASITELLEQQLEEAQERVRENRRQPIYKRIVAWLARRTKKGASPQ